MESWSERQRISPEVSTGEEMFFEEYDLYVSGDRGYQECRIPALLTTLKGTILAFNEARKFTGRDSDQINLFLRRSFDGGKTFDKVQVVATEEGWVCGNPAPVQDRTTGTIWLLFCKNLRDGNQTMICEGKAPRTVWVTHSLTVRLSYDECRTWPVSKVIYEGPSSYSDICIAPDGTICCLYEKGQEKGVSRYSGDISFARFDLEWLTDGADTLNPVAGSKEVTDNDSTKREI